MIVAALEATHTIVGIDYATKQIVWQYGIAGRPGPGAEELDIPDGVDWRH